MSLSAQAILLTMIGAAAAPQTIDQLIGAGKLKEALKASLQKSKDSKTDVESWRKTLKIAGWISAGDEAIEALAALAELEPDDLVVRQSLAQRYLWAQKYREAEPHVDRLMEDPDKIDAVGAEVITWVLINVKRKSEAVTWAKIWAALAPDNPSPRWVIADLTHWTSGWRTAREQYDTLVNLPDHVSKSQLRLSMLRKDHPTRAGAFARAWSDNIGALFFAVGANAKVQLPYRLVVDASAERGRMESENAGGSVGLVTARTTVAWEMMDELKPEVMLNFDANSENHMGFTGGAAARFSYGGWMFGRFGFDVDRVRTSINAMRSDVKRMGPFGSIYMEPKPWIFMAGEAEYRTYVDDNTQARGLLAVGTRFDYGVTFEPRAFVQYDKFKEIRTNAQPYYTPTIALMSGTDLTVRYTAFEKALLLEGKGGLVLQGTSVFTVGNLRVDATIYEAVRIAASAGVIGNAEYRQIQGQVEAHYIF